jgi:glycosyltransferase involved in cell wall biosynthesis
MDGKIFLGKIVVVIPAYNEELYIGNSIDLIRDTGIPCEIIVVNDGSTDGTEEVAKRKGAKVMTLKDKQGTPVNRGKAAAFFAGIREAAKSKPDAVVTLDADLIVFRRNDFIVLAKEASKATRERKIKMVVGNQMSLSRGGKEYDTVPLPVSGIRSFSLQGMHHILSLKSKKFAKGFGLEPFLNRAFPPESKTVVKSLMVVTRENFRGNERFEKDFHREHEITSKKIFKTRFSRIWKHHRISKRTVRK